MLHDITVNMMETTQMRVRRLLRSCSRQKRRERASSWLKQTSPPHVMVAFASNAAVDRGRGAGVNGKQLGGFALKAGVSFSGFNPPVPRSFLDAPLRFAGLPS